MAESTAQIVSKLENADYYRILGVERSAQAADVKRAFYRIAAYYHPDRYDGEEEQECVCRTRIYKLAVEAYTVLSRPDSRASYDQLLASGYRRMDAVAAFEQSRAPKQRSLAELAESKQGRAHAAEAERLWQARDLEGARAHLVSACRYEPQNKPLRQKHDQLYRELDA